MDWATWISRWLPIAAVGFTLMGLLDPLEGFPIVLIGGVLSVMSAIQTQSRHFRVIAAGLACAVGGCAAMFGLSWFGGVGAATGRSPWWLLLVAPYPVGVLLYLVGTVLILRARWFDPPAAPR